MQDPTKDRISRRAFIGTAITVLAGAAFVVAMIKFRPSRKVKSLPGVEVTQYQGEDLSSINDFQYASIMDPPPIDISAYKLDVTGLVQNPLSFTYDEILNKFQSYKKVTKLFCVEGWGVKVLWQGVLVKDILAQAGPLPTGRTVIFHCADDGYTTSLPIEYFGSDSELIMANKVNDVTLPPERGYPFMLVAEASWGYKWAKWITGIEISDNTSYKGYWESRGYSNYGGLDQSYFGF